MIFHFFLIVPHLPNQNVMPTKAFIADGSLIDAEFHDAISVKIHPCFAVVMIVE